MLNAVNVNHTLSHLPFTICVPFGMLLLAQLNYLLLWHLVAAISFCNILINKTLALFGALPDLSLVFLDVQPAPRAV